MGASESTLGGAGAPAAVAADPLAKAHDSLIHDPSVQFSLPKPAPPPKPPQWLEDFLKWLAEVMKPIGRFFEWIASFVPDAPYAKAILWITLALVAAALLWMVIQRLRTGVWALPKLRRATPTDIELEEEWQPDAAPVREWLQEADALAERGQYAQAVHHLLLRSVEDISRRRPHLVKPAITSRELAVATVIPDRARGLFSDIAALVERSLFGGRSVGSDDWSGARQRYADFAQAGAWRA